MLRDQKNVHLSIQIVKTNTDSRLNRYVARIVLHEYDHMNGVLFTSKVSKFKLQRAKEKAEKEIKKIMRAQKDEKRA